MNDSSNICLSCGLCCDGTLLGFVQLDKNEFPAIKEVMEIEVEKENGFFLQPCNSYCDGCSIYDKRPKQCSSFKCGLLHAVEQKELHFDLAVNMIDEVKLIKRNIENKIVHLQLELRSPSFYFQVVELKKMLRQIKSETELDKAHSALWIDLDQLDILLLKNFDLSLN